MDLANETRAKGMEMVTVILHANPRAALATADRLGVTSPVLQGDSELQHMFHVDATPWTVIVDRHGKAVEAFRGGRSKAEYAAAIAKYL